MQQTQLYREERAITAALRVAQTRGPAGRVLIETPEKTYIEDHPELNRVCQPASSVAAR
jgi:hypothetical protein